MEGVPNRETFQLLQLSDESKSLSDFELPEFITQRKKKVRRKTRHRASSQREPKSKYSNNCDRLTSWLAIFLVFCWLLTLSYMLVVIRVESLRLEIQIKKLAVANQNLPDALQKWHETSRDLLQNQTIIYGKIAEIQHSIESLSEDFLDYKTKTNSKEDYSKNEKFVADFGAKIEAVTLDVETIREKYNQLQKNQDTFINDLSKQKASLNEILDKATIITNNKTVNCSEEIEILKNQINEKINSLSSNISSVSDVMNQKTKDLDKELVEHKKNLDGLLDSSANITSHVTSMETDWTKYKDKFGQYEVFTNEIKNQLFELDNSTKYLEREIYNIGINNNKNQIQLLNTLKDIQMKANKTQTDNPVDGKVSKESVISNPNDKASIIQFLVNDTSNLKIISTTMDTPLERKPKYLSVQATKKVE